MNEYIFYTCEGYTYPPKEDEEIENCQVLGRALGKNIEEAKNNLLKENPWIEESGFAVDEIVVEQILTDGNKQDIQTIVDYLWETERKHFQKSGKPEDHIYHALKRLKGMVS